MSELIHSILKKYWGYDSFRPLQEPIIQAVLEQKDVLALMPTGGGKSICFQVPAMALHGLCIVVTPLIALMQDQVKNLREKGIVAYALHSGMSFSEMDIVLNACVFGKAKFLYLSPERLKTELFKERLPRMNVCLLAVDEAHCISQWGYDFRPAYLEIAHARQHMNTTPVIALTATATPKVVRDIQEKLQFKNGKVFQKSFARSNLSYSCLQVEDKEKKLCEILRNVPGTSVIYVRSRKKTKEIAEYLNINNIKADYYHAGLSTEERTKKQSFWIAGKTRVIVATNAFGMGIDKPDVRTVIHLDLPESLEAYYQEAGRAGRDEKKAYAVILYNSSDIKTLHEKIEYSYPESSFVRKVYQCLASYCRLAEGTGEGCTFDFDEHKFTETYKLPKTQTYYSLKRLQAEGFISLNDAFHNPSKIFISAHYENLYKWYVENPEYELLVKTLLRIYGGNLFSEYVPVHEKKIAQCSNLTEQDVQKKLYYLTKTGILSYLPKKENPQITFLTPRYDAAKLPLNQKKIKSLYEADKEKIEAMIAYVTSINTCRTTKILEYFGEIKNDPCNVCDICRKKIKEQDLQAQDEYIQKQVSAILHQTPLKIKCLMERIIHRDKNQTIRSIRKMIDLGIIIYNKKGELMLNKLE
ncbi:MAG: RecQ family ATP-dependent DNA helicase [Cytophagaceae bacterium]|nr:RecQ family ATP-dependent DNA helicase [Cytophagaceae bacterium]MDW8457023.1 ATP-dependent DNA helicase RecQ [Cytophagaceae bacterium]